MIDTRISALTKAPRSIGEEKGDEKLVLCTREP